MTADGKITTREYSPVDFTSREDKMHLLRQRALADACRGRPQHVEEGQRAARLAKGELRDQRVAAGKPPAPSV
jgi:hypothetical protein